MDKNLDIKMNDSYRLEKALEIYLATGLAPSLYFEQNPPKPIIEDLPIFEIVWERKRLRERIEIRTEQMLEMGLLDEVAFLEAKYRDRTLTPLKAIGIKEVLSYFDGEFSKEQMREKISTNTARLAKRQVTFNATQFRERVKRGSLQEIEEQISTLLLDKLS